MVTSTRLDFGRLGKARPLPGGGILVPAYASRTGIQAYGRADGGQRLEYRPAEEVFAPESLETFAHAPVTLRHPPTLLDTASRRDHEKGHGAGPGRRDGDKVLAELAITDPDLIGRIDRGEIVEVSVGYRVDFDPTPIEVDGRRVDGTQRNIRVNHIALGPEGWGRAGRDVRLRLDSNDGVQVFPVEPAPSPASRADNDPAPAPAQETSMKTIRIDGVDYEIGSPAHLQAQARHDEAQQKRIDTLEGERDQARSERDGLQGRFDAQAKELTEAKAEIEQLKDPARIDAAVADRLTFVARAQAVLGPEYKADGKTEREIMVEAITKADPEFKAEGRSDGYLEGRFDELAKKSAAEAKERKDAKVQLDVLGAVSGLAGSTPTTAKKTEDQVRKDTNERLENRWKQGRQPAPAAS